MSGFDQPGGQRRARRSLLFRSRPDALQVDEWVPNITLPPPPDTPLLEEDPDEQKLDEHGLPEFEDEPEEDPEERAGPARIFVGVGMRGAPAALPAEEDDEDDDEYLVAEDDFFVAELRLPRPEDSLPFRVGPPSEDDDEAESDYLLDAAEASDPSLAMGDLDRPFSISLEAPDPVHLGAFQSDDADTDSLDEDDLLAGFEDLLGEDDDDEVSSSNLDELVSSGLPPLALQPSPARRPLHVASAEKPEPPPPPPPPVTEPDADDLVPAQPPARPETWARPGQAPRDQADDPEWAEEPPPAADPSARPRQGIRARPFWTPSRPKKETEPQVAPRFQTREADLRPTVAERLFNRGTVFILCALLVIAAALYVLLTGT